MQARPAAQDRHTEGAQDGVHLGLDRLEAGLLGEASEDAPPEAAARDLILEKALEVVKGEKKKAA